MLNRGAICQVNGQSCLTAKHQVEWGETSAGMNTRVVSHTHFGELVFPVDWVVMSGGCQHTKQGAIASLHKSIALRMIGRGARLPDPQDAAL